MNKIIFILLILTGSAFSVVADGVYQSNEQFLEQAFNAEIPKAEALWLTVDDKTVISAIMSRKFNQLRVRFWQQDGATVWILDEIGKEKPITIGVHIKNEKIVNLKVLAFRESRGDEVRHQFFTKQFINAELNEENQLTQHIDGITGATLSVRALNKVARLALWLDNKTQVTQ
ncbi:FMN-binding protein [Thalassotalea psychrophila]|uniref:FMN-binding protein n=1 Tax=Thalassotalea psychrophila TaxID=3065647 RepID=A0ABY9TST1_9GAMM|nr:FMN-binding protein [Colwelliaceae bacterium SQ149]